MTSAFETLDAAALRGVVGGEGEEPSAAGANTDYGRDGDQITTRSRTNYGLCLEKAERDCDTSTRWGPFSWFRNRRAAAVCYQKTSPRCVPFANPGE